MLRRISSGILKARDRVASLASNVLHKEKLHLPKGEVFWVLRDSAGNVRDEGHFPNVVTRDASILVARLVKGTTSPNQSEPSFGAYCLAVGTGDVGWNLQSPPSATNTQRSLFNEIGRKVFSSTTFVAADGSPTSIPTNVVDLTTIFSESEAVGALTEMGIIGGDCSTNMATRNPILPANGAYDDTVDTVGKDLLVNYRTFKVINKDSESTLSWTWRLTF